MTTTEFEGNKSLERWQRRIRLVCADGHFPLGALVLGKSSAS